ncbi:MAG TPA: hypothetical protein VKU41_22810 [Polyangiaceae bacterium]|nr:hypothetical protein [Polyangiaceae bacterium]
MTLARFKSAAAVAAAISVTLLSIRPAAAVDARTEAAAKAAMKKANQQYLRSNYAAAASVLDRAARACGVSKCSSATRAAVLRDLGTMQVKKGDQAGASKSFTDAIALQPGLELDPDYDTSDVRSAFEAAKGSVGSGGGGSGGGGAGGGSSGGAQPAGDFTHHPAPEQQANTPLPIYVQVPEDMNVVRVVVKYKGAQMDDWTRLELNKLGRGWAGLIPCAHVTTGTIQYWIQGFDQGGEPVASSGDPKHPYTVPIRSEITAEAPHLPGKPAPAACAGDTDCPPGSPGCGGAARHHHKQAEDEGSTESSASKSDEGTSKEESSEGSSESKPSTSGRLAYAKIWLGVSGTIDFVSLPQVSDVCLTQPNGQPANASNMYCTAPDGTDFPPRSTVPGQPAASPLTRGQAGTSSGGLLLGNVRVMLTFDYALSPSLLLGGRFGYVINSYPGQAAANDGRAFGAKFHVEARATYLFGDKPLARPGFAPMVFGGLGASEFDGHTTTFVLFNGASEPVDAWLTNGPFFLAVGAGARYQFSLRAAFTAAARLNLAVGGNGVLPTYGPEVGLLYGF